jgi:hypothetical protein
MAEQRTSAAPAPASRAAALGPRVLLALAACALTVGMLAAAELLARLAEPGYVAGARGPHVFSGTYGWESRRATSLTLEGEPVTFNERGHRGRALSRERSWRPRVVVLGDSIAFGLGVSDEETFSSRLAGRGNGIEVANLAVQGYGPDQELLLLEREALGLRPDVVVLAFCMANDLAESALPVSLYDGTSPKPRFRLEDGELVLEHASLERGWVWRTQRALADHSHLFNRLASLTPPTRAPLGRHWRERYDEALRQEEQVLALNTALVSRMNTLCLERGIGFVVVAFPDQISYRKKTPLQKRFFERLGLEGVRVLDMSQRFRGLNLRLRDVALDPAGHLNPRGHSIVSGVLESELSLPVRASRGASEPPLPRLR